LKLFPAAAITGIFSASSWATSEVICWPTPPSLANQF
jgi:hypothetical protein